MPANFDYFVIYAGMRTGSNYLEASLNEYSGIHCYGELFNPHFIGGPKKQNLFGVDLRARETNPMALISNMKEKSDGLPGFRFFHDHDPRVLEASLADTRCAKVFLERDLLESYISREIARKTDQWRLGDLQQARSAKVRFDPATYLSHVENNQTFQNHLRTAIQTTGQTAFSLRYQDLSDVDILNGLVRFLGFSERKKKTSEKTKKQNPSTLKDKVENFVDMKRELTTIYSDRLSETQNFEPPRGPAIPTYITAATSPLLYLPVQSGPVDRVKLWLDRLDSEPADFHEQAFTQKTLRHWKRRAKGHRSFTVLRHPAPRLHDAFVRRILMPGEESYPGIRSLLKEEYGLPLPDPDDVQNMSKDAHRQAFMAFTKFITGNLNGQTSIRVDPAWASQAGILRGMARFIPPDYVFREDELDQGLTFLAGRIGRTAPDLPEISEISPVALSDIYDDEVEKAVRACYQRDYMMFGFGSWAG